MAYSLYSMVWDLQGMSAEVGRAKLWCCAPQVCTSCKDLRQLTPCTGRLAGEASEGDGTVFSAGQVSVIGICYGICSLVPDFQSRMEEDHLFSSSDLKHVAEVCCRGWNFPLVGVRTNSAISGYLHILVCSHFVLVFYGIAMGIFPLQQISKKMH